MRGFPSRYKIIARRGSYHGMTYGAMSLTAIAQRALLRPVHVRRLPRAASRTTTAPISVSRASRPTSWPPRPSSRRSSIQGPETVAAVIGEPISTAAGVHVPSTIYWQMLREICDRHGVLLIADEVINGFGRTGKMFATEHFGIVPDIMTMAKGLSSGYAPIAAAIVRDSVFEIFKENRKVPFGHLLTFGGHPVACRGGDQEPRDLR